MTSPRPGNTGAGPLCVCFAESDEALRGQVRGLIRELIRGLDES